MKQVKLVILSAAFIMLASIAGAADKPGNPGAHHVKVRVFDKGKSIDHLKKEDFTIYEDKKPLVIDEVNISRKKIDARSGSTPRFVVLLLDTIDYNRQLQICLDYILMHILKPDDQLLIAANERTLFFRDLSDKEEIPRRIDKFVKDQGSQARQSMVAELSAIEKIMNLIRIRTSRESEPRGMGQAVHLHYYMKYIKFSLEQYISALQEYKKRHMMPDITQYCYLLKPIKKLNREKWVIRFYQVPEIPKLSQKNRDMMRNLIRELQDSHLEDEHYYAELFTGMLAQIDDVFNRAADFPVETMSQLFYKTGAPFHSIILESDIDKSSKGRKYRRLLEDIENSLAEVAQRTGGVGTSLAAPSEPPAIETALDTLRNTEDNCYTLTYTPKDPEKPGKLNVEVNNKNYKVFYENTAEIVDFSQYLKTKEDPKTPLLRLRDVTFKNKKLSISIASFLMQKTGTGNSGRIVVRIYVKDNQNAKILFDQSKDILPRENTVHISLDFQWLKKGRYEAGVHVKDLLTGKNALEVVETVIN
ncbi:MAG: hypothetical protein JSV88_11345 [Candidatus Aminicenantes bacterium]|nr:MAG: hypothetical protein JSV88_11345 [Candidatus Aminicenantes bacterium]